jgi:SAM-dependent methyltransferase
MEHFTATTFGERFAEIYDQGPERADTLATVAFLEQLAGGGPALELAIGTGRVALPLAARGVHVGGVEISPEMLAKMRAKPGGDQIAVTLGDFADVPVQGTYRLVFVVFNTLFNLVTQEHQVRCFQNVAAHLTEDGVFVVEAFVPDPTHFRDGQYVDAEAVGVDEVWLDVCRHDAMAQRLDEVHVSLSAQGVRLYPVVVRYAWPSELDLMARIAGLRLKERWAGWAREPFTSASNTHVSVYGR